MADGLFYLPDLLHSECSVPRRTQKESVREIVVADLGDATQKSPYLIVSSPCPRFNQQTLWLVLNQCDEQVRHATDDVTIYEPFNVEAPSDSSHLRLRKISNPALATGRSEVAQDDTTLETRLHPMQVCPDIGGYSTVFLPGSSPSFVLRSSRSMPKVIGLQGAGVRGMSSFHTEGCERGFIYADNHGIARVTQFPSDTCFELGVSITKVAFNVEVKHVAFHTPTGMYAIGCGVLESFELPKDEPNHPDWTRENIEMKPSVTRGRVKLISPVTWTEIQDIEMEPCEDILCMKALELEVSEVTKERRQLVAIGTSISKGEDLPVRGRIYVYDIVTVIPEPGRPETNKKLKLIAKEDIPRGAVTALSEVGSQGLMLVAQGQKCMVRGLKEDGSLLPVAFMDMSTYVTAAKELRGNSLCLMSDAYKGVWLTGYSEEPYKMQLFGKSNTRLRVRTADFLPDHQPDNYALFIVVSDADGDLHILQYEPERMYKASPLNSLLDQLYSGLFLWSSHFPPLKMLTGLPRRSEGLSGSSAVAQANVQHARESGNGHDVTPLRINRRGRNHERTPEHLTHGFRQRHAGCHDAFRRAIIPTSCVIDWPSYQCAPPLGCHKPTRLPHTARRLARSRCRIVG
jgi:cleavage and polyadenylation specificity factor subunit 1